MILPLPWFIFGFLDFTTYCANKTPRNTHAGGRDGFILSRGNRAGICDLWNSTISHPPKFTFKQMFTSVGTSVKSVEKQECYGLVVVSSGYKLPCT